MTSKNPRSCLGVLFTIILVLLDFCLAGEWLLTSEVYEKTVDIKNRGLAWLKRSKNQDYGWDAGDTPTAILAIAAAEDDWPVENDLNARLSAKQLEIELLDKLIRHDVEPVTPARISLYALALNGVCKDPRNFYGRNLIASLEKHHTDQDYPGYPEAFGFSFTSFVSCLSGSHLHKRQIRHLVLISNDETSVDSIDTRTMAILALECFRRKRHNEALTKHVGEALKNIARLQQPDGSFGNIHTSTMAIQALAVADEVTPISWNRTAAALALSTMQRPDGSFSDSIHATSEAVIATTALLNGVGLLNLKRGKCIEFSERPAIVTEKFTESTLNVPNTLFIQPISSLSTLVTPNDSESQNKGEGVSKGDMSTESLASQSTSILKNSEMSGLVTPAAETIIPSSSLMLSTPGIDQKELITAESSSSLAVHSLAKIKFWIWIGPDPVSAEKLNISVEVPVNSTFFTVMRRAAEQNPQFEFSATVWPNGHYIHTLSGQREQPVGYHYWLLYKLPMDPNPQSPPPTTYVTPAGVDNLLVQDGEIYLYWYKKL